MAWKTSHGTVVLIAQDAPRIEAYTRGRRGWRFEEIEGLAVMVALEAFGIELPLAETDKRKILWDNCAAYYAM